MRQLARQLVDAADGFALRKTHLIIDRDTKYAEGFRELLESAGVKSSFALRALVNAMPTLKDSFAQLNRSA
jgi:hypothetical protein